MSPSHSRPFLQMFWLAGILASLYGAWFGIRAVVAIDALAPFRIRPLPASMDVGVTLNQVSFGAWQGKKRLASGKADQVLVFRDRSRMILTGVKDGRIFTEGQKKPLAFETPSASYAFFRRQLSSDQGATIKGDQFSITTPSFVWEERASLLRAPDLFQGTLYGGQVKGRQFQASFRTGKTSAKNVYWAGLIQDPARPAQKRKWEFRGDVEIEGDLRIYTNGRATDGEVIVKAPRLEHNAKSDVLTATGGVRYWSEEVNLAAPKVVIYRRESRTVATEGVFLYVKSEDTKGLKEEELFPIPQISPDKAGPGTPAAAATPEDQKRLDEEVRSARNLRKYPAAIRAQEITYWYKQGERRAKITGSPQARQELDRNRWRMVWAHEGDYDGEGDWLTLRSRPSQKDVRIRASTADDFRATEARVSTKENDDRLTAKDAEGVSYIDDEEEIPRPGTSSPPRTSP